MNQTVWSMRGEPQVAPDAGHSASLMRTLFGRLALPCAMAAMALLAAGCATRSVSNVPVEDRGTGQSRQTPSAVDPGSVKQLPGFENAGKPGYYSVKPGDTMIRIGLESGQNWRDIVRWNNLDNPNVIERSEERRVGKECRL